MSERTNCVDCGHRLYLHKRARNGAYRCHSSGCGCEVVTVEPEDHRPRKLTRQEQLQGLADRGIDTWRDYNCEN